MRIFFLFLIPVLFVVHMIAALFSPEVRKQVRQHQLLHLGWLVISLLVTIDAVITSVSGRMARTFIDPHGH